MSTHSSQRRIAPWAAALCLPTAAALVWPSAAMAAGGASTLRATIDGNGAVQSVKQMAADGSVSSFSGSLPLKMSISKSGSSYSYHVENTFSKSEPVTYTDTKGKKHTTNTQLQLPIVAQLGVNLPASVKDVQPNSGGVVITEPDGSKHVLWQLVMFSPLGSPTQDLTFTYTGSGSPVAELEGTVVDPATSSLNRASQDATASFQQDDFWQGYASGGDGGLTKLRDGMGQIVDGLGQLYAGAAKLHTGLAAAGDGANKLDAGTKSAYTGSKTLSAGVGKIAAGNGSLATGLGKIHTGQGALTGGIGQIHDGQGALTDGLGQISGGLNQLADATAGLPAASAGIAQVLAGLQAISAGVGDDATANTLVNGVDQLRDGLGALLAGMTDPAKGAVVAVTCAKDVLDVAANGLGSHASPDACFYDPTSNPTATVPALPAMTATDAATGAVRSALINGVITNALTPLLTALNTQVIPGLGALYNGAAQIRDGLSHKAGASGATDPGGVAEGLAALVAGTKQLQTGIGAAATGVGALAAGATQALDGSKQLTDGSASALSGSKQLTDGSGEALTGAKQLASGSSDAYTGSKALVEGLKQLSDGQHQVATGLPAAVDGSGQIADGLKATLDGATQVKDGIGQVQDGAVSPLNTQLQTGSQNAHATVAIVQAAAALGSQAPGGAGASYVLTQDPSSFKLSASSSPLSSDSHTGRNVGLGLGGFALLVLALFGGFALGRRNWVGA